MYLKVILSGVSPPLACIEMSSTFFTTLSSLKSEKINNYLDQHCYAAHFETIFY